MNGSKESARKGLKNAALALFVSVVLFASQLGGGANTGGVFPAPLLILGLIAGFVSGIALIICGLIYLFSSDE